MAARKPRAEGATYAAIMQGSEAERRPADPVPGNNGEALQRIVDYFKVTHPDQWEVIRLCPTQHGLDEMVALLA